MEIFANDFNKHEGNLAKLRYLQYLVVSCQKSLVFVCHLFKVIVNVGNKINILIKKESCLLINEEYFFYFGVCKTTFTKVLS